MSHRTIASALGWLLLTGSVLAAAQAPSPTVTATPGPTTPRPQTPPRDGAVRPNATGTGRIRGRVVAAETGAPLPRAHVRVSGNQPGLQAIANTDADGRYEFQSMPAATYMISVSRTGYVTLQFGQQRAFEPGKPLTVGEGEVVEKIDFALPRGGVVTGRVVDQFGEPQPGVRIQAQRYVYQPGGVRRLVMDGSSGTGGSPVTDDLGQFRVYGLMPGSYILSATPTFVQVAVMPGPATSIAASNADGDDGNITTYYPGAASPDEAQAVTIGVGQETAVSFALLSARLSRVSGSVRTSQGNPPGRVLVSLRTQAGSGMSTMGAMTLPDGSFSFNNVAPGEHFIDVRPGPNTSGITTIPGAPTAPEEFASVPFTATGQDISGLVITTGLGATISGRMIFEGSSPPPAAMPYRVSVTPSEPSSPSMGPVAQDNGVVDRSGYFQIRGAIGKVLFRLSTVNAPMPPGWYFKSVMLNGVDITDTPYDAKPSTNVTGLEVTLSDRQTMFSGAVVNFQGEVVKNFLVVIFPATVREDVVPTRFTRIARPNPQGRFDVRGLPPGDYVAAAVEFLEQGSEWNPAFQQQIKPRGKLIRLTDGETTSLDLTLVQ